MIIEFLIAYDQYKIGTYRLNLSILFACQYLIPQCAKIGRNYAKTNVWGAWGELPDVVLPKIVQKRQKN